MLSYLVKRLLIALPVLLGVTVITFTIINLAPGDVVDLLVDPNISATDLAALRESLGLNDPVPVQYAKWLGQLLQGNLGYSYVNGQAVAERIGDRMGATLSLSLFALLIAYLIAIPVGVISATKQYSLIDYISSILALVGVSVPNFFLGIGLIYVFALKFQWLPVSGMYTLGGDNSLFDLLRHMILPAFVLGAGTVGQVTRYTRSAMLEVVRQDFIRTARAKGVSQTVVIYKHALRNALIPVITLLGLQIPNLLGGAIITEQIFSWPGMGRLSIEAISSRDYPVLMGLNLMAAVLVVLGGLVSDILYSLTDPRIRYS